MGYRNAHLLKKVKTMSRPTQFIFFDTETTTYKTTKGLTKKVIEHKHQKLKMGYACHVEYDSRYKNGVKREWIYFTTTKKFYEFLDSKIRINKPLYVISANIWFDMRALKITPVLTKNKWKATKHWTKGMACMFEFRKGDRKFKFVNLQNFFPMSVSVIGEAIGFKKIDIDLERCTLAEMKKYCKRDTLILVEVWDTWLKFLDKHKLGPFAITIGAQAMSAFKYQFMTSDIFIHNNYKAMALERRSYRGGRTECFRIGKQVKQKYYKLDINSFYPHVMRDFPYPTKLKKVDHHVTINQLRNLLEKYCITAFVELDTKHNAYAIQDEGKTIFPVGNFKAYLNSGSLEFALEQGDIKKVLGCTIYDYDYIFEEYIDFFYKLRLQYQDENNGAFNYITKLFMNSLYGKFGQMMNDHITTNEIDAGITNTERIYNVDLKQMYRVTRFAGLETWESVKTSEGFNSFVGISAHVTDYARILLYQDFLIAGKSNVFYCDTDSMIVNERGYNKMKNYMDKKKLGAYKLEGVSEDLKIWGAKDYEFDGKKTIKGISKRAVQIDNNTFQQLMFPNFKSEVGKNLNEDYKINVIQKTLQRNYDKGDVSNSGKVTPFEFEL